MGEYFELPNKKKSRNFYNSGSLYKLLILTTKPRFTGVLWIIVLFERRDTKVQRLQRHL